MAMVSTGDMVISGTVKNMSMVMDQDVAKNIIVDIGEIAVIIIVTLLDRVMDMVLVVNIVMVVDMVMDTATDITAGVDMDTDLQILCYNYM